MKKKVQYFGGTEDQGRRDRVSPDSDEGPLRTQVTCRVVSRKHLLRRSGLDSLFARVPMLVMARYRRDLDIL